MILTKILEASGGRREAHAIITVDDPSLSFDCQLDEILSQYGELRNSVMPEMSPVFHRIFLSDSVNQQSGVMERIGFTASVVEQAPLNLTKIALWVWMIEGAKVESGSGGRYIVEALGHRHLFETGRCRHGMSPSDAMHSILTATGEELAKKGGSLLKNCVRTWLFVRDIEAMCQINAPSHLNPTYEYGVAFERATRVDYADRSHLFVSGTASIDNRGT